MTEEDAESDCDPDGYCVRVFGDFLKKHDPLGSYCGLIKTVVEETGDVIFICSSCKSRRSVLLSSDAL